MGRSCVSRGAPEPGSRRSGKGPVRARAARGEDPSGLLSTLGKLLNCDPMRISKKFVGSNCIGKQVFRRRQADMDRLSPEDIKRSRFELAELERRFLTRVAQSNRSAKSSGAGGKAPKGGDGKTLASGLMTAQQRPMLAPWLLPPHQAAAPAPTVRAGAGAVSIAAPYGLPPYSGPHSAEGGYGPPGDGRRHDFARGAPGPRGPGGAGAAAGASLSSSSGGRPRGPDGGGGEDKDKVKAALEGLQLPSLQSVESLASLGLTAREPSFASVADAMSAWPSSQNLAGAGAQWHSNTNLAAFGAAESADGAEGAPPSAAGRRALRGWAAAVAGGWAGEWASSSAPAARLSSSAAPAAEGPGAAAGAAEAAAAATDGAACASGPVMELSSCCCERWCASARSDWSLAIVACCSHVRRACERREGAKRAASRL